MKNEIKLQARAYMVQLKDARTGEKSTDTFVLSKEQLQAGGLIGMTDEDIIYRIYNRQGYRVLSIGNPSKKELTVDLGQLYRDHVVEEYLAMEESMGPGVVEVGACDTE